MTKPSLKSPRTLLCWLGMVIWLALGPALAVPPQPGPARTPSSPVQQTPLGANLPAINDYARTPVYVDLMHQARRFGTAAAPWDEKALLGADGWPVGDFGVFLMTGQAGVVGVAGRYTVSFIGQAEVTAVASPARLGRPSHDAGSNRTSLSLVLHEHTDQLALSFTHVRGNIRDLKVIRPGYDTTQPPLFTRPFLAHLKRFQTLRFMDWLRTNNNDRVSSWATRASPERSHYASAAGVPWEHIIALANQTGKDIWINIPVRADDDYVRQLARLLKATLRPDLRLYVEYSNELWNSQFWQFGINRDLAVAEVQDHADSPLRFDGSNDKNIWMYRRIAKRLKEISDIFRSVHGDAAMMNTVRPVFASQVVQPHVTELGLKFIEAVYGPPSRYFFALAGAPYFNLGSQQNAPDLTTDQVLQAMELSVSQLARINQFETNLALARWYGLAWLAYEGGADTFGPGSIEAKKAASLDPRLQAICRRYLESWYESGGDLFMWFTAGAGNWDTKFGSWELTTDLALTDTPKIRCLDAVLAVPRPQYKSRNTVPGRIDALAHVGNFPPYGEASLNKLRYLHPGNSVDYLLLAPQGGHHALVLNADAGKEGNTLDLALDGRPLASKLELRAKGWNQPVDNAPVRLTLAPGWHTLRITTRTETSGFHLRALTFTNGSD